MQKFCETLKNWAFGRERSFNSRFRQIRKTVHLQKHAKKIVLVEFHKIPEHQIAYAHLLTSIQMLQGSRAIAYADPDHTSLSALQALVRRLKFSVRGLRAGTAEATYRAFGVASLVFPHFPKKMSSTARRLADEFLAGAPSKEDVETFSVHGIVIGDLVYDHFLSTFSAGTIQPNSEVFETYLRESVKLVLFWEDFFSRKNVTSVIGNSVYRQAIVARVAIGLGVDVFDAQINRVVRLSSSGLQFEDTRDYHAAFLRLDSKTRANGLSNASEALSRKKAGEPDASNSHLIAPNGVRYRSRLVRESTSPKILIAPHKFSDSAHAFGAMLFPDFEEWLKFLAEIVRVSSADWYLKPHPAGEQDIQKILQIFNGCQNLTTIPHDASLQQLAEEGIDLALTLRGHIGFEFPLLGVPVISATPDYRYRNYKFNHHATTKAEYRKLLSDFSMLKERIKYDELCEFYFMDTIYNHANLFFPDLTGATEGSRNGTGRSIFESFIRFVPPEFTLGTISELIDFVSSDIQRFRRTPLFESAEKTR
jgi:hypothetical protein